MRADFLNAEDAEEAQKSQKVLGMESDLSREIIGAGVEVQRLLGVGLLESAYKAALAVELNLRGIPFEIEVPISTQYKGRPLGVVYRADIVVAKSILVELKATDLVVDVHRAQLLSYLRLSGLKLGLLMNFHAYPMAKNVIRVANKL